MKSALKGKTVYNYSYDIERSTSKQVVDTLIDEVLALGMHDRIFLIGHSFGGVVAIDAVRTLIQGGYDADFKVMTVASPLGGSGVASMMRLTKPFSQFLKNVGAFDTYMTKFKSKKLPCPVHSVVSTAKVGPDYPIQKSDGVVTVDSQLHYQHDPHSTLCYIESNHFEVLLSQDVTKELKLFLF